jgi:hypothetical protein
MPWNAHSCCNLEIVPHRLLVEQAWEANVIAVSLALNRGNIIHELVPDSVSDNKKTSIAAVRMTLCKGR